MDGESVTENLASGMREDEPEERETSLKMWLVDKVTSFENQNEELKRALQEMEMRLAT